MTQAQPLPTTSLPHKLFDHRDRDDPTPCRELEDSFSFLNRVDTPFWEEVRSLLDDWFEHYPDNEKDQFRKAFRSRLPGQHYGAWWELYLHELFRRLDYEIEVHPQLEDSTHRPDFLLARDGSKTYLEAAVLLSGMRQRSSRGAPPWMLEAINEVTSPNFFLRLVRVSRRGEHQLRRREIIRPIEAWLNELDPDAVSEGHSRKEALPQIAVDARGWELILEAWPVKREARGKSRRALGIGPMQVGYGDDVGQLRSTLKKKAGRYGQPEIPLVIAVQCLSAFMEPLDIEQALWGSEAVRIDPDDLDAPGELIRKRNGFWATGKGPQYQRVSAVLIAVELHSANVGRTAPTLWTNTWAHHPLRDEWPFSEYRVTDQGQVQNDQKPSLMNKIFSLPADWPAGDPFPRA